MVEKVVTKTRATVQAWGVLYKAFIQMLLIYGSERWVVMGTMLKVL